MCVTIHVDGEQIQTLGQFRDKFGEPEYIHKNRAFADCHCLCPIAIEETAKRLGYALTVDPLAWHLTKGAA